MAERYEIVSLLGQGGMGSVYLGRVKALGGRLVAIKEMVPLENSDASKAASEQFQIEAQLLATLKHPGLVDVTDYFQLDGRDYLVMEYVDGVTLKEKASLEARDFFSVEQVYRWGAELADILHYLHTHDPPVIFRDLKPSNIMLDQQGRIRLIDFGIASIYDVEQSTKTFIKGRGTAGYAPLEQYGAGRSDPRTDVYSLGATLYTLLTGQTPPPSVSILLGTDRLTSIRSYNPTVPHPLEAVILSMMALKKEMRPATVQLAKERLVASQYATDDATGGPLNLAGDTEDLSVDLALLLEAESEAGRLSQLADREGLAAMVDRPPGSSVEGLSTAKMPTPKARRLRSVALVCLVLLLVGATPIAYRHFTSDTIYLTPDGPLPLAEAVRKGKPVHLKAGTYQLTKSLALDDPIVLTGDGRDTTKVVGTADGDMVRYTAGGPLRVSGITFESTSNNQSYAFRVLRGQIEIRDCRFTGAKRKDDKLGGSGLRIGGDASGLVANCEAVGNQKHGIQVQEDAVIELRNNRCWENTWAGIGFLGNSTGKAIENECFRNGGRGLNVMNSASPTLDANVLRDNAVDGIRFHNESHGIARNNECVHNLGFGINVVDKAAPTIESNKLERNGRGDLGAAL